MADQLYGPSVIAKLFEFDGVRRVDQLVQDGILTPTIVKENGRNVRKYDLIPTVQSYVRYLKEKAERKSAEREIPEILDMAIEKEKADLEYKQARAGKMKLELAELEGQMHRAEDVEIVATDMLVRIRAAILSLPGRLAVDTANANTAAETSAIIKAVVDDTLNELAEYKYNPAEYRKLVQEREKWLTVKEAETAKAEKAKAAQPKTTAKKAPTKKSTTKTSKSQTPKRRTTSKASQKS